MYIVIPFTYHAPRISRAVKRSLAAVVTSKEHGTPSVLLVPE